MIEIKNLYLKYIREYYALYDINLKVSAGESIALVGEEGSGKTTLLRVLAKLEKFDKGEVYVKEINLKKLDFKNDVSLGYISATPVFMENKTVYENLKFVLKNREYTPKDVEDIVNKAIIEFNIEKFRDMKAKELSVYEKYMISLIRLTLRPLEIVLVDDIFENVSDDEKTIIVQFIKHMFVDKKVTTLVATSSDSMLKGICKKTIHFKNGSIE